MGLFGRKNSSNPPTPSPKLSPGFNSQSSAPGLNSPKSPISLSRPVAQLPSPPNPSIDPEGYLTCLQAVRQRSQLVYDRVRNGKGTCFTMDPTKIDDVIRYVVGIIKVPSIVKCANGSATMIRRIRLFHRMDVGNILMLVDDHDSKNSFNRGVG